MYISRAVLGKDARPRMPRLYTLPSGERVARESPCHCPSISRTSASGSVARTTRGTTACSCSWSAASLCAHSPPGLSGKCGFRTWRRPSSSTTRMSCRAGACQPVDSIHRATAGRDVRAITLASVAASVSGNCNRADRAPTPPGTAGRLSVARQSTRLLCYLLVLTF